MLSFSGRDKQRHTQTGLGLQAVTVDRFGSGEYLEIKSKIDHFFKGHNDNKLLTLRTKEIATTSIQVQLFLVKT